MHEAERRRTKHLASVPSSVISEARASSRPMPLFTVSCVLVCTAVFVVSVGYNGNDWELEEQHARSWVHDLTLDVTVVAYCVLVYVLFELSHTAK